MKIVITQEHIDGLGAWLDSHGFRTMSIERVRHKLISMALGDDSWCVIADAIYIKDIPYLLPPVAVDWIDMGCPFMTLSFHIERA